VKVPFSYLPEQFADPEPVLAQIRRIVASGDFTLGGAVAEFEKQFAALTGARHAIGVNSGTDALRLVLKALGVGPGDDVLTCANTFIATVGAIADVGARTRFVDCTDDLCMDLDQVEKAITPKTKAIIPVHMSGAMVDMKRLMEIARPRGIHVLEDACQAIKSSLDGRPAGSWAIAGAFSLHPLKFLNIWGDGGVIVTSDDDMDRQLRLLRNHGLESRDVVVSMGVNSRLDTIQAAVALQVIKDAETIVARRNDNAAYYDQALKGIPQLRLSPRSPRVRHSFVTYQLFAERRDELAKFCEQRGVECKVHYPIALYRQEGLKPLGYREGDFPVTDRHARTTLTLPVHQYLSRAQLEHTVATIKEFYAK
jgi:dTDP-4-amino-4,6-dideoxygalactose transaminase